MEYNLKELKKKLYVKYKEGDESGMECYGYILEFDKTEFLNFKSSGARKKEIFRGRVFIGGLRTFEQGLAVQSKLMPYDKALDRAVDLLHLYVKEYSKRNPNVLGKKETSVTISYKPDLKLYSTENSLMKDFVKDIEKYESWIKDFTKTIGEFKDWKDNL